jgi:hypothetical protein
MRTRPGFAPLRPLIAITSLAAATVALLSSALALRAPPASPEARLATDPCVTEVKPKLYGQEPADRQDLRELAESNLPYLRGLNLRSADLREMDLRNADLFGRC